MAYKDHQKALDYYREYNLERRNRRQKQARQIAIENGETHYFTGKPCKHGHISLRRVKDRKCNECENIAKKEYVNNNKEIIKVQSRISYIKHKEKHLAQKRKYRQANKGAINSLNAARKERIKKAIAKWLTKDDLWIIKEIYRLAEQRTKLHGFQWHVDHIIPIKGDSICGLHVPKNLQVIPWLDNIRKKNKYEAVNV